MKRKSLSEKAQLSIKLNVIKNGKIVGDERTTCHIDSNLTQTPQDWVTRGNASDELHLYGVTRDMVPNPINTNSSEDFQLNLSKF
jgi:hypothetical protein